MRLDRQKNSGKRGLFDTPTLTVGASYLFMGYHDLHSLLSIPAFHYKNSLKSNIIHTTSSGHQLIEIVYVHKEPSK